MTEKTHTDRNFDDELGRLRRHLLAMAGRVEQMVDEGCRALLARDAARSAENKGRDRQVNQDECDIDDAALRLLGRWQPMASDLRFILLCLKVVTDLERLGDLAVNMGERNGELVAMGYQGPLLGIPELADRTARMVHGAIEALAAVDGQKAQVVIDADEGVDQLHKQLFRSLLDRMATQPEDLEAIVALQSCGKYLERMADHATNIAEQVIFLVASRDVRHLGNRIAARPT
jgi:phosphate transport system protein